jgi:predicted Zn-dependent protease
MPRDLTDREECRRIAERALRAARVEDASVRLVWTRESNTRFANNEITTSGAADALEVTIRLTADTRTGIVTLNEITEEALTRAVHRAEELAGVLPPDPEYPGPLPPQDYASIEAYDEATLHTRAADRIPGVRAVVGPAAHENLNSSGFFTTGGEVQCVANRAGNFGWHRSTSASFSATARTADGTGSGWAQDASWRLKEIDPTALAERALRKARDSAGPRPVEPGDYTVILEPAAVAGLLGFGFTQALSARAAEEGRSFFSKKGGGTLVGEALFHESVTLRSDPTDPRRPGLPWAGGGFQGGGEPVAATPFTWVEKGVVKNLWIDRSWAVKTDRALTPPPGNLVLEGGTETIESLIASTERGLLVTNFWYIRSVNPQTLMSTGLTRDGVWLVEKGKIVHPVVNLRWNESPAVVLANVEGMTPAIRAGNAVVPALKARAFTFTSVSDAV